MNLNEFLPIILYILLIVLIILLIILIFRLINTLKKIDLIVDDVNNKVKSLDGVFNLVDGVSSKMNLISDRFLGFILSITNRLFKDKKTKKEEVEDE